MDILTQSPLVTFSPAPSGAATLAELQQLKAAWLQEAVTGGHLEAARLVTRTLGEPGKVRHWNQTTVYTWQPGAGVEIRLYEGPGKWLPRLQRYDHITTLAAFANGHQVVYYRQSDDPTAAPDNFFVPGNWLGVVYDFLDMAKETERGRCLTLVEQDRRRLQAQLLIGLEV